MTKAIKVIYDSPAQPQYPYDIELNLTYDCVKENDEYFIKGNGFNREFTLDFIKRMFKPCEGYGWEMLEEKNKKKTNLKQTKKNKEE